MIENLIKELEGNKKANKRKGLQNIVDIDYILERLRDIELDYKELNDLLESYKELEDVNIDIMEDLYKKIRKTKGLIYDYQMNDKDNVNYKELLYILEGSDING